MEEKESIKVGVIGCGWITKEYCLMTKFIKNTEIAAAMDLDIDKAIKVAGKDHAYSDLEKMYDNENLDAVYIATPHHLHKPMIKRAFERGKHILCEKPITISMADAREINELDKKYNNLKLGINYNYRYDQDCYKMAMGVQNGHIGEVYYANCNIFFSRDEKYFEQGAWRTKKETAGGGTLIIHGSHTIDVMIWALGEPISVQGKIDTLRFKKVNVEDVGFGIVEFENGSYAQINNASLVKPKMSLFGDKVELQIFGQKGRVYYKGPWPFTSLKWKGVRKYKIKKVNKGVSHFGRSIKAFADWVLHDKPFHNTVEQSSKVLGLTMALYKSSETGKKESIEKL